MNGRPLKRLHRKASWGGAVVALGAVLSCSPAQETAARPNVLLIVVDALRADSLSSYSYHRETTPNIDRLARAALLFQNAISVGGNTATVMSAIMTGRYPFFRVDESWDRRTEFGLHRFYRSGRQTGLPEALETLAEIFARHGYDTAGVTTNPFLKSEFGMHRGFSHYVEIFQDEDSNPVYGRGEQVSAAAKSFLDRAARPFFLYLHYMDVHGPYLPPERFRRRFNYPRAADRTDSELFAHWVTPTIAADPEVDLIRQHMKGNYDAEIAYADHCIGLVLEALETLDLADDTIVAITADHGDEFLEHGGTTHVGTLYDEIVHVPLILRIPGQRSREIPTLVRNFDLGPTLLDYAGIEPLPGDIDARTLRPLIDGITDLGTPPAFANFPFEGATGEPGALRMLRTERYKLLFQTARPEASELYDLQLDPGEQTNVFQTDHAASSRMLDALATIVAKLEQEAAASGSPVDRELQGLDPETEKQLRSLGYLQ